MELFEHQVEELNFENSYFWKLLEEIREILNKC